MMNVAGGRHAVPDRLRYHVSEWSVTDGYAAGRASAAAGGSGETDQRARADLRAAQVTTPPHHTWISGDVSERECVRWNGIPGRSTLTG